uniref:succinate dehydrogenase n=1 Tax=Stachyamoeba lipophora TaxID=463046 RepID=A0A0B5GFX5_STALP|nr:succinate dehydrogenase subunit 2 [Stachyamoeba lipophora]AJF22912.1 succinate dehydrogenase subunit 2 [Stachyamoeba lipophora]
MRYDPFINNIPYMQTWFLASADRLPMMLDNLFFFKKNNDESFSFRRSCREGICGSCAMNINGLNTLACTYKLSTNIYNTYYIFPLPHMPIIKDLIVCMKHFYEQHKSINPFLIVNSFFSFGSAFQQASISSYSLSLECIISVSDKENYQSKKDRFLLDGLYECILCACCSTSCPSYWWNKDKYLGPAVLLQAYRWIIDSRDSGLFNRLSMLNDTYKLYRCHTILNCSQVCPKHLSPAAAISNIKTLISM